MEYTDFLKALEKHLYNKFKFHIVNRLGLGTFCIDKKELLQLFPTLNMDLLQRYLDAMYEDHRLNKDDGITVWFIDLYIHSLKPPKYFN